eukprot:TRINITY_DN11718_c0_g1_i1.p1 TRINITY_DN11718_c0_g1~~TRINITY_DN11718_c0_g1_i1.p1  ORF type:complete len:613 (+),score=96.43 TRINITY_DN11718_c0_g1_i1:143-1981(+)
MSAFQYAMSEPRLKMSKERRSEILANLKRDRELRRKKEQELNFKQPEAQDSIISAVELPVKEEKSFALSVHAQEETTNVVKDIKEDAIEIPGRNEVIEEEVKVGETIASKRCESAGQGFKFDEHSRIAQEIRRKYQRPSCKNGIMTSCNLSPNSNLKEACEDNILCGNKVTTDEISTKPMPFFSLINSPASKQAVNYAPATHGHRHIKVISVDADRKLISSEESQPVDYQLFVDANELLNNLKESCKSKENVMQNISSANAEERLKYEARLNCSIAGASITGQYCRKAVDIKDCVNARQRQEIVENEMKNSKHSEVEDKLSKFINIKARSKRDKVEEFFETGEGNTEQDEMSKQMKYTIVEAIENNEEFPAVNHHESPNSKCASVNKKVEQNTNNEIESTPENKLIRLTPKRLVEVKINNVTRLVTERTITKGATKSPSLETHKAKCPKMNKRSLSFMGSYSTNLSTEKSKSSREMSEQECTFRPRINASSVSSYYSQPENILGSIKQKEREKIRIQEQAKRAKESKELTECTFRPEIKTFVGYLNRPVVKGLGNYVKRQQRKKSIDKEQRTRENNTSKLVERYDKRKNRSTVLQPFKLSQRSDAKEYTFHL